MWIALLGTENHAGVLGELRIVDSMRNLKTYPPSLFPIERILDTCIEY